MERSAFGVFLNHQIKRADMENIFGKKIGPYILLDLLGVGGMAKVYNAFDARIERNVAIKIILPSKHSSQVFQEQFEREARALANLTHTNIVKVLDYGIDQGQPYLVMEYIQGGTLKQALKQPLAWQKAAEILAPIARALDYVHGQKIVHRDIKPSNILIDEEDRPMLSDFGVVKLIEDEDENNKQAIGVGVGTPDYMSPEQGMGKETDFRADIYSLGVVFYELVTGTKPFTADTPMAVVIRHTTDEFPRPSEANKNIPDFVEHAILRAVQKDPRKRYANMGDFAHVLELIALGEQTPRKEIEPLVKIPRIKTPRVSKPTVTTAKATNPTETTAGEEEPQPARKKLNFWLVGVALGAVAGILALAMTWHNQSTGAAVQTGGEASASEAFLTAEPILTPPTETPGEDEDAGVQVTPAATRSLTMTYFRSPLALMGTPVPSNAAGSSHEIARWGIGAINDIAWSPDGKVIAMGTSTGIFLYDAQTYRRVGFINTDSNIVRIIFHADGQSITAGSTKSEVIVYNLATGAVEQKYTYHMPTSDRALKKSSVSAISYSRDGKNIAIGYQNGAINYFAVNSSTPIMTVEQYPAVEDLGISADGKTLYVANGSNSIQVWDLATQRKVSELAQSSPADKLRFSRDRTLLLSGKTGSPVVFLWDLSLDRMIISFSNLGSGITSFDFSSDKSLLAIGLNSGEIRIYTTPDLATAIAIPSPILSISGYHEDVTSLAFSPNGMTLASGNWGEGLKIWDPQRGEELFALDQSMYGIDHLFISQDGQWLASGHVNNTVKVWEIYSGKDVYQFDGYLAYGYAFSLDNRYLAIVRAAEDQWDPDVIRIVELSSGAVVAELPGYISNAFIRFSDDSTLLAMGTTMNAIIWDTGSWERLNTHGGASGGCEPYYTPQSNIVVLIADAGVVFDFDDHLLAECRKMNKGQVNEALFGRYLGFMLEANNYAHLFPDNTDNQLSVIPEQGQNYLYAIGSKYGSIHIWTRP